VAAEPAAIVVAPAAVTAEPEVVAAEPEAAIVEPEAAGVEPEAAVVEPEAVIFEPAAVVAEPVVSNEAPEPAAVKEELSAKTVTFAPDLMSPAEDAAKPLLADTPSDVWCTPRGVLGDWTNSPVPLSAPMTDAVPSKAQAAQPASKPKAPLVQPASAPAAGKKKGKKGKKARRASKNGPMIAPVAGQKVRAVR